LRSKELKAHLSKMSKSEAIDAVSNLTLGQIKLALREHVRVELSDPYGCRLIDVYVAELIKRLALEADCQYSSEELIEDGKRFSSSTEWKKASASKYHAAYRRQLTAVVFPRRERINDARFREIYENYDALCNLAGNRPLMTRRIMDMGLPSFASMSYEQIELWLKKRWKMVQVTLAPVYPQFTPKYPAIDATLEDML